MLIYKINVIDTLKAAGYNRTKISKDSLGDYEKKRQYLRYFKLEIYFPDYHN